MKHNAFDLFLKQKRFDLIFKYLYIKNKDKNIKFFEDLYAEHIRAFNDFHEIAPSDGVPKESKEDFINSFNRLYDNMSKNGFDKKLGAIPIGDNGDINDGAHRLVCAAVLGLDIDTQPQHANWLWNYKFFQNQGIDPYYADYAALEYVKINPNAYIVNLQPVISTKHDKSVEDILEKYGFIYYKKNVDITLNGLINLKKLSYGSCWEQNCDWIGNYENGFAGAVCHAKKSFGRNPLRVYVFVCDNLDKVISAKKEIRKLFNIGNFCVHINDTRQEAIELAETYFNENSLHMINNRPYTYQDKNFDTMVDELKQNIQEKNNLNSDDFCCLATSVFGLRYSGDLDLFYLGTGQIDFYSEKLSDNSDEFKFYPLPPHEILYNPKNYLYYKGIKFVSANILLQIKQTRNKIKDKQTCKLLKRFCKKAHSKFKIFKVEKQGKKRTLIFFNLIKIKYKKH